MDNWRLNQLKSLLKEDPNDEFLQYALAQEFIKQDEIHLAVSTFEKLKAQNTQYVGLYYHLAATYLLLDKRKEALSTYQEGITVAKEINDQHALSELQNARMNLEIE